MRSRPSEPSRPRIRLVDTSPRAPPRSALILGGSRGIGQAVAARFVELGYRVQIVGRDAAAMRALVAGWNGSDGRGLHSFRVGSVTDAAFWDEVAGSLVENEWGAARAARAEAKMRAAEGPGDGRPARRRFDHRDDEDADESALADIVAEKGAAPFTFVPDVLVNCAGVIQSELLLSTAPATISTVLDTNLTAAIVACRVLSKHMMQAKIRARREKKDDLYDPCIVNVASVLASHGGRGSAVYAASKAGVVGLTRALASELGPLGVRVNCVNPGYIGTKMLEAMAPKAREAALEKIPLRRFGKVEEVAHAVEFLTLNKYANNCVITLDGGLTAVL